MKKTFYQWLLEVWGISCEEWDENYNPTEAQGRQIMEEYEEYLEE